MSYRESSRVFDMTQCNSNEQIMSTLMIFTQRRNHHASSKTKTDLKSSSIIWLKSIKLQISTNYLAFRHLFSLNHVISFFLLVLLLFVRHITTVMFLSSLVWLLVFLVVIDTWWTTVRIRNLNNHFYFFFVTFFLIVFVLGSPFLRCHVGWLLDWLVVWVDLSGFILF